MYHYDGNEIMKKMSDRGYTSYKIRKENILPQGTLTKIKKGGNITLETLNTICCLLKCQISDIVHIEITDEEKIKYF
ncbi:MAG: helix-turn-helix transcriptional regulator [Lachnospiraceae bacterium]|nr:helix-turn-helix transcriptional regulator [Lachnospiraceae bacterium]